MPPNMQPSVAIVGGGCAGLTVAAYLTQAGIPVTLYEAAPQLGGRARRVTVRNQALDNGQHIMLGAYHHMLDLLRLVQPTTPVQDQFLRIPLTLEMRRTSSPRPFRLTCPRYLPAPLHLAYGLLAAKGLHWHEKWLACKMFLKLKNIQYQLDKDIILSELLTLHQQTQALIENLWEPLCLAALNTPVQEASAQVFLNVLHDSFQGQRADSDFWLPRHDLSTLLIEPVLGYLTQKNALIHTHAPIKQIVRTEDQFIVEGPKHQAQHSHVVIAVAPHQRDKISYPAGLSTPIHTSDTQPICTVYLQFSPTQRLHAPMVGLTGTWSQWVFDRGQLYGQHGLMAVVISTEGPHLHRPHTEIVAHVLGELSTPSLGLNLDTADCQWSQVIIEKRATYACTVKHPRVPLHTNIPNLYFVGDDIHLPEHRDYPATIEGAVRGGVACAKAILAQLTS